MNSPKLSIAEQNSINEEVTTKLNIKPPSWEIADFSLESNNDYPMFSKEWHLAAEAEGFSLPKRPDISGTEKLHKEMIFKGVVAIDLKQTKVVIENTGHDPSRSQVRVSDNLEKRMSAIELSFKSGYKWTSPLASVENTGTEDDPVWTIRDGVSRQHYHNDKAESSDQETYIVYYNEMQFLSEAARKAYQNAANEGLFSVKATMEDLAEGAYELIYNNHMNDDDATVENWVTTSHPNIDNKTLEKIKKQVRSKVAGGAAPKYFQSFSNQTVFPDFCAKVPHLGHWPKESVSPGIGVDQAYFGWNTKSVGLLRDYMLRYMLYASEYETRCNILLFTADPKSELSLNRWRRSMIREWNKLRDLYANSGMKGGRKRFDRLFNLVGFASQSKSEGVRLITVDEVENS